jgi:hypothetical protein
VLVHDPSETPLPENAKSSAPAVAIDAPDTLDGLIHAAIVRAPLIEPGEVD